MYIFPKSSAITLVIKTIVWQWGGSDRFCFGSRSYVLYWFESGSGLLIVDVKWQLLRLADDIFCFRLHRLRSRLKKGLSLLVLQRSLTFSDQAPKCSQNFKNIVCTVLYNLFMIRYKIVLLKVLKPPDLDPLKFFPISFTYLKVIKNCSFTIFNSVPEVFGRFWWKHKFKAYKLI